MYYHVTSHDFADQNPIQNWPEPEKHPEPVQVRTADSQNLALWHGSWVLFHSFMLTATFSTRI